MNDTIIAADASGGSVGLDSVAMPAQPYPPPNHDNCTNQHLFPPKPQPPKRSHPIHSIAAQAISLRHENDTAFALCVKAPITSSVAQANANRIMRISSAEKSTSKVRVLANVTPQTRIEIVANAQDESARQDKALMTFYL